MGCQDEFYPANTQDEINAACAELRQDLSLRDLRSDAFYPVYTELIRDPSNASDVAAAANQLHIGGVEGGESIAVYMMHPNWPTQVQGDDGTADEIVNIVEFVRHDAVPLPVVQGRLNRIAAQAANILFNAQLN